MKMFYDGGYLVGMHAWWWLFWVVLVGISLYSFRGRSATGGGGGRRDGPNAILQRRLAAGEITPPQYEERKALLDRDAGLRETT
jgi:putative membrane protein